MEINNSNAMIHALKNAAKNSPDLANELRSDKGEHHKEKTVTIIESKKIGVNDIPSSIVDLGSVEHRPNINANLDTSEMRLLRYKNAFETDAVREQRISERNTMRPKLAGLQDEMKPLYEDFKQQVASVFPDLADKEYGISVDEKGELIILNNKNSLNEPQQDILNGLLNRFNGSNALKQLANEHVEATVNWVELDRKPDATSYRIGMFDVNKENYHEVIDLVPMLKDDKYSITNQVINQVFSKAELTNNRHQVDEFVNGEWVNIEV